MTDAKHIMGGAPLKTKIGKQIKLPLSKAVEISLKSLRIRFWRSMLTVSSIILAIAFLTYVWTSGRVQSSVAVGMRADAARVAEFSRTVDDCWKPFEHELDGLLSKAIGKRRGDYKALLDKLYAGDPRDLKDWLRDKEVDLSRLPYDAAKLRALTEQARSLKIRPDLEGWPVPALRIAGIKSATQAEVNRFNKLELSLQRLGLRGDESPAQLGRLSPTAVWLIVISLLVCGVGISNAMLMSVTERFREIGTMKCLGALDGFIVKLFLLESTFQGVAGTLIGVVIGLIVTLVFGIASFGWTAVVGYFPVLGVSLVASYALVIGAALSVAASVMPALRAARMAPVEAMRVEE